MLKYMARDAPILKYVTLSLIDLLMGFQTRLEPELCKIVKKGQTIVIDNLLCLYRKKALNQVSNKTCVNLAVLRSVLV